MYFRTLSIALALSVVGVSLTLTGKNKTVTSVELPATAVLAVIHRPYSLANFTASPAELTDDDIRRIGREAYVWGWPLVYMHNCRAVLERVPAPGRCGGMPVAPPNELSMLTDYLTADQRTIPCPNHDVVYGFGIFDLGFEPVVVQIPDFGDRFWVYQLGDQRTDGFAEVGAMYGTKPGLYLVAGPDWNGTTPDGIADVFRCPTQIGYCMPRIFLDDTQADRQAVLAVVNQIMAYPLSRYDGQAKACDWSKYRWFPQMGSRAKRVVPETFFDTLAEVLGKVPPLAGEEAMYGGLRRLLAEAERNTRLKDLLTQTAIDAEQELLAPMFEFRNVGTRLVHHWTTITNGAAFGSDYQTRAAVAKSNVFVNRHNETKYFYQDLDAGGERLNGRDCYQVTFAAGQLPPAKGLWSLTLYDEHHVFYRNELNRYSYGTKSKQLRFNADGSLTIHIQHVPPADAEANWLPAPAGNFSLYLRAYWPQPALLDGTWLPPPVVKAANGTSAAE